MWTHRGGPIDGYIVWALPKKNKNSQLTLFSAVHLGAPVPRSGGGYA